MWLCVPEGGAVSTFQGHLSILGKTVPGKGHQRLCWRDAQKREGLVRSRLPRTPTLDALGGAGMELPHSCIPTKS